MTRLFPLWLEDGFLIPVEFASELTRLLVQLNEEKGDDPMFAEAEMFSSPVKLLNQTPIL